MWKKILLSTLTLGTFAFYAIHEKTDTEEHLPVAMITPIPTIVASDSPTPIAIGPTPVPTQTPAPKGKYKDGSYIGPVADAFYGPLQVKVIIAGGKITDVQFLKYPNDRQTSIEINRQAMPYLKEEAIIAQSAKVDGVSGATQTSHAFIETLGAALDQAI